MTDAWQSRFALVIRWCPRTPGHGLGLLAARVRRRRSVVLPHPQPRAPGGAPRKPHLLRRRQRITVPSKRSARSSANQRRAPQDSDRPMHFRTYHLAGAHAAYSCGGERGGGTPRAVAKSIRKVSHRPRPISWEYSGCVQRVVDANPSPGADVKIGDFVQQGRMRPW